MKICAISNMPDGTICRAQVKRGHCPHHGIVTAEQIVFTTPRAALNVYSTVQRKLYGIHVYRLANGWYDTFPAGYPVPAGADLVK